MSNKKAKGPSQGLALNAQVQAQLVNNLMLERQQWIRSLLDPRRDIAKECGHPENLTIADYLNFYKRGDISARVISIWPEECWSETPQIYESEDPEDTDFEKAWKALELKNGLFAILEHADTLSGIGRFGIILLGVNDGLDLKEPIPGLMPDGRFGETPVEHELLYVRTFDESCVQVGTLETDITNVRYGMPKHYNLQFQDTATGSTGGSFSAQVHWSRVIHVADNRISSEIFGQPRLERVANRLLDLAKIAGGSGEMFWKGGFPGISFETVPELLTNAGVEIDTASLKTQAEAYMNGLQRYVALSGMSAKSLDVQIADPRAHGEFQMKLIAAALGVPWRIFIGSEAAQLASEQDIRTWNRRIGRRRKNYITPRLLRPFLQRLVDIGVLSPRPKEIFVHWTDLNSPSDKDKSDVAKGLADAMVKYVAAGVDQLMPPFHFLTLVLGLSDEEAQSIVVEAGIQNGLPDLPEEGDDALGEGELSRSSTRTKPNGTGKPAKA